jgi:hypothetical protein
MAGEMTGLIGSIALVLIDFPPFFLQERQFQGVGVPPAGSGAMRERTEPKVSRPFGNAPSRKTVLNY